MYVFYNEFGLTTGLKSYLISPTVYVEENMAQSWCLSFWYNSFPLKTVGKLISVVNVLLVFDNFNVALEFFRLSILLLKIVNVC